MRHSSIIGVVATACLSIAVSLIAASLFLQPLPSASQSAQSTRTTEAVQDFYAAANEVIATGQLAALDAVVAPHFVDQAPLPGMRPGREGLEDYLLALHATVPALKLVAEPVLAVDDRGMARVAIEGLPQEPPLAGTLVGLPVPWGPVDLFHVAGDKIVERWTHVDGLSLVRPLASSKLELAIPTPRHISLKRVSLEPGATWRPVVPGPEVLVVEKGVVHIESGSFVQGTKLAPGQALELEPGSDPNVTNLGMDRANLLLTSLRVPAIPGPEPTVTGARPPSVSAAVLAGDLVTDIDPGSAILELGHVTLAPRARMMISSLDGPTLLALDAGQPEVTAWGRAHLRRGRDGMSVSLERSTLAPGDGVLLHPGSSLALQNTGSDTVRALVLTIRPAENTAM